MKFLFLFHNWKTCFAWNWALLSQNSIFQHRETKQEMKLMTCGLSCGHVYGPVEQEMEFLFGNSLTCKVPVSVSCSLLVVHCNKFMNFWNNLLGYFLFLKNHYFRKQAQSCIVCYEAFLELPGVPRIVIQLKIGSLPGVSWSYDKTFSVSIILYPVLKIDTELLGGRNVL